jgi:hypothetical protein
VVADSDYLDLLLFFLRDDDPVEVAVTDAATAIVG